jgi:hypothetical protein
MRAFHLVMTDIIEALGGPAKVGKICAITPGQVYKWRESPDASGQTVPIKQLQIILGESKKHLDNIALQSLVSELLNDHFASLCGRGVMLQEKVAEIIFALQDGYKPAVKIRGEGGQVA